MITDTSKLIAWAAALLLAWPATATAQPDEGQGGAAPVAEGEAEPTAEPEPEPEGQPEAQPEPEPEAGPEAEPEPEQEAKPAADVEADADKDGADKQQAAQAESTPPVEPEHQGTFSFGSYGRVIAATDLRGRPARNADIVAHGSRLDHDNYVELELRRDDHWAKTESDTRFVATLALGHPLFHYDGDFDAEFALRNLYIEESHLGLHGLSFWAGSRMLRGDDIYLLDFWPLDNLNTIGGGFRYEAETKTTAAIHLGLGQPDNPFYKQQAERAVPLNQFGTATVDILDRVRWVGSARLEQLIMFGGGAGMKLVGYGEVHELPSGQRETEEPEVFEDVLHESGWVVGGQIGAFSGQRDTHVNLFARYAEGLSAYGEFAAPGQLSIDGDTDGAHELLLAVGGNFEFGPITMQLGAYLRSFRNASEELDFGDVDEGIVIARPHVFFTDWLGLALEGSYQAQQRGVLASISTDEPASQEQEPLIGHLTRFGAVPFITPAGPGSFARPMFWFIYTATFRDDAARKLYPVDDPYRDREVDHFFGLGAEWWFGSTSYGGPE